ncbi:DUF6355 family natural product biosynthesis protein [Streptomyces sp. NPDC101227]|uniref:DUF6355 family natural product biosynthesis protein n=1 Tax=Streptomyces sp. NPDC101227 TaxID=3366136 RepID=UPI003819D794
MRARRLIPTVLATILMSATAGVITATPAVANPCGFYETGSDAFYNHCTGDGSNVVIEVEVFGPNYERCVGPGRTWLGSAGRIQGAHYTGRTC